MSTSAEGTQNQTRLPKLDPTPQPTPVIIKLGSGGDEDPPKKKNKVTINGQGKTFESTITDGDKWRGATSTATAGIISLTVEDGSKNVGTFNSDFAGELAALLVINGPGMFVFRDVAVPDSQFTKITIASPVDFTITEALSETASRWMDSDAEFPDDAPFLLFVQGTRVLLKHQCESTDVTLMLNVDWDEVS